MRMRKKKWADPWLEDHAEYIYADPVQNQGKWKDLFHSTELHVEIGMGKGDYLIHMAEMYPEIGWVGMEKDHSAAAVASRKALEAEPLHIENNRMICGYAEDMQKWFADGEIDVIHLNFSDPWPKKHAHKKRLSSSKFLEMYRSLLSEHGCIRMKTDNKDLFEDSVLYFLPATICILRNSMQGFGDTRTPLVSSVIELIGKVLIAIFLAPAIGYMGVIVSEPIVWAVMVIPLLLRMKKMNMRNLQNTTHI